MIPASEILHAQFGAREIPREDYRLQLTAALDVPARWIAEPDAAALTEEIRALAGREGE